MGDLGIIIIMVTTTTTIGTTDHLLQETITIGMEMETDPPNLHQDLDPIGEMDHRHLQDQMVDLMGTRIMGTKTEEMEEIEETATTTMGIMMETMEVMEETEGMGVITVIMETVDVEMEDLEEEMRIKGSAVENNFLLPLLFLLLLRNHPLTATERYHVPFPSFLLFLPQTVLKVPSI